MRYGRQVGDGCVWDILLGHNMREVVPLEEERRMVCVGWGFVSMDQCLLGVGWFVAVVMGTWWKSCMDRMGTTIRSFSWLEEVCSLDLLYLSSLLLCMVFCGGRAELNPLALVEHHQLKEL